jgi:hypothetical protein
VVTDYVSALADRIRSFVPLDRLPEEPHRTRLFRAYAVLARAKGDAVTPSDVHDAWVAWMVEIEPQHDALRPFEELSAEDQEEDLPYVEAIRAALRATRNEGRR